MADLDLKIPPDIQTPMVRAPHVMVDVPDFDARGE
jgi:hypothetical protein